MNGQQHRSSSGKPSLRRPLGGICKAQACLGAAGDPEGKGLSSSSSAPWGRFVPLICHGDHACSSLPGSATLHGRGVMRHRQVRAVGLPGAQVSIDRSQGHPVGEHRRPGSAPAVAWSSLVGTCELFNGCCPMTLLHVPSSVPGGRRNNADGPWPLAVMDTKMTAS